MLETLALLGIVGLLALALSTAVSTRSRDGYLFDERRHGRILTAFGIAGSFIGGGTMLALLDQINRGGLLAAGYLVGALVSLPMLAWVAPRWRSRCAASLPDAVGQRFGPWLGALTRTIGLLGVLGLLAVQLGAVAVVVAACFGADTAIATAVVFALVLVTTALGGFRFDAWSDVLQYAVIFLALVILVILAPVTVDARVPAVATSCLRGASGWSLGAVLVVPMTIVANPVIFHRVQGSSGSVVARQGAHLALLLYALPTALLIGLALTVPPSDVCLSVALLTRAGADPATALFALGVLAATVSSMDSHLLTIGALAPAPARRHLRPRLLALAAAGIAFFAWHLVGDLFRVLAASWLIMLAGLLPSGISLLLSRAPGSRAISAITLAGLGIAIAGLFAGFGPEPLAVAVIACSALVWCVRRSGDGSVEVRGGPLRDPRTGVDSVRSPARLCRTTGRQRSSFRQEWPAV
ncbi:MAG: sodium:solute symporter family transporter, partial [Planctomycetota bacterium]